MSGTVQKAFKIIIKININELSDGAELFLVAGLYGSWTHTSVFVLFFIRDQGRAVFARFSELFLLIVLFFDPKNTELVPGRSEMRHSLVDGGC